VTRRLLLRAPRTSFPDVELPENPVLGLKLSSHGNFMGQFGEMDMRDPVGNDMELLCLYMLQPTHKGSGNAPRELDSHIRKTALHESVRKPESCVMESLLLGAGMGHSSS
jgi:hypothetical protein